MSGGVQGPNSGPPVGLLLLEHQQQLVKEGADARDAAHEVGLAAKKVETIYNGIQKAEREWEQTMAWVSAAMSTAGLVGSIKAVPSSGAQAQQAKTMTQRERFDLMNEQWRKQSGFEKAKDIGSNALSTVNSVGKHQMQQSDEANKKWAESMKEVHEKQEKLSETLGRLNDKEQEVSNEAFKLGSVFSRAG